MPQSRAPESELIAQLRELNAALNSHGIVYCAIGGLAVNAHGVVRATHDLDVMLAAESAESAHNLVLSLGYQPLQPGDEIASYVRSHTRLDILFARRAATRDLLARAIKVDFAGEQIPLIPVEGLLGLKIQAFNDNPARLRDLQDIIDLVRTHRDRLNLDEVRAYFRLFDREIVLDDILQATRNTGADGTQAGS